MRLHFDVLRPLWREGLSLVARYGQVINPEPCAKRCRLSA
jgi:hypothetical protein